MKDPEHARDQARFEVIYVIGKKKKKKIQNI
jgi:hypothetical protein